MRDVGVRHGNDHRRRTRRRPSSAFASWRKRRTDVTEWSIWSPTFSISRTWVTRLTLPGVTPVDPGGLGPRFEAAAAQIPKRDDARPDRRRTGRTRRRGPLARCFKSQPTCPHRYRTRRPRPTDQQETPISRTTVTRSPYETQSDQMATVQSAPASFPMRSRRRRSWRRTAPTERGRSPGRARRVPRRCDRRGPAARRGPRGRGGGRRARRRRRRARASPASGPSLMPTATARLSADDRRRVDVQQLVVKRDDAQPVGRRPASGAVAWTAASSAWMRYGRRGAGRRRRAGPGPRRWRRCPTASGPAPRASPARRRRPGRARRACCSSISASSPRASSDVGHQLDEQPAEPDRLGGQVVVGGRRVALGEHEVDHGEHTVEALGEGLGGGTR